MIRTEEDQTILLARSSFKEHLLSSQLAGKEHRLAKFALQPDCSRRHVSKCILSYVLSIGLIVQSLQQDVLDEEEFPLISYARLSEISCLQDFEAVGPWMERHLFAGQSKDNECLFLFDYVKAPAPHECNYPVAWFMGRDLQCSLMRFWNEHMARYGTAASRSKMGNPQRQLQIFFFACSATGKTQKMPMLSLVTVLVLVSLLVPCALQQPSILSTPYDSCLRIGPCWIEFLYITLHASRYFGRSDVVTKEWCAFSWRVSRIPIFKVWALLTTRHFNQPHYAALSLRCISWKRGK